MYRERKTSWWHVVVAPSALCVPLPGCASSTSASLLLVAGSSAQLCPFFGFAKLSICCVRNDSRAQDLDRDTFPAVYACVCVWVLRKKIQDGKQRTGKLLTTPYWMKQLLNPVWKLKKNKGSITCWLVKFCNAAVVVAVHLMTLLIKEHPML